MDSGMTLQLTDEQWLHVRRDNDATLLWTTADFIKSSTDHEKAHQICSALDGCTTQREDTARAKAVHSLNEIVILKQKDGRSETYKARANVVRCNRGNWISATLRIIDRKVKPEEGTALPPLAVCVEQAPNPPYNSHHARHILSSAFGRSPRDGVIAITGATKSCKTSLARSLVSTAITELRVPPGQRLPHLVTLEDPIEEWKANLNGDAIDLLDLNEPKEREEPTTGPNSANRCNICLTAREIGKDVVSIKAGLEDALRQTPACVYIGEVRNPAEWPEILSFGGTGHLVIATFHASSVREGMAKIIAACGAKSPAERRQRAGCLRAIVHSRLEGGHLCLSLWRRTAAAINSLVSVGLSSVAPNNGFHLGRLQYCESLLGTKEGPRTLCLGEEHDAEFRTTCGRIDIEELMNQ